MDKLEFKTTIEDVIRLFGPEGIIYSQDHTVFLRELVQNSMDSIVIYKEQEKEPDFQGRIVVRYEESKITITDNGWGLDRAGIEEHFARPLRGIQRYLESGARTIDNVIGHFGVGFLSVFKVSDYVEIETQRNGCQGVAVNLGLKRSFVRGKSELMLQSFVNDTNTGMPHGMKVTVYLGSADSDTDRRAGLVNSEKAVSDALEFYIKHPPVDIDILSENKVGIKTRFESVPFRGQSMDIAHRINVDGIEGYIAYSMGLEKPVLQVCQRGLLVKENYPTLLSESVGSIVGEINLTRTDLADLSLSRETFIENEKYNKLKSMLAAEVFAFDERFKAAVRDKIARSLSTEKAKYTVNENSEHATSLLEMFKRGIQKNIYHHKICTEVSFYVESEDRNLILPEIVELVRSKNRDYLFVYERDMKYLYTFTESDKVSFYCYEQNRNAAVEILRGRGDVVVRLTKRDENAKLSFVDFVSEYFRNSGLGVTEIEPGRIIDSVDEFPVRPDKVEVKVIEVPRQKDKRAFIYRAFSYPIVYLNRSNEQSRELIETSKLIATPKKKLLIEAYLQLAAGNLDNAANSIYALILQEPLPEPAIEPLPDANPQQAGAAAACGQPDRIEAKTGAGNKASTLDSILSDMAQDDVLSFFKKWFKNKRK